MLKCECQLSVLKARAVPDNDSVSLQEYGRVDYNLIATDVGSVSVRDIPHHSHQRKCLIQAPDSV